MDVYLSSCVHTLVVSEDDSNHTINDSELGNASVATYTEMVIATIFIKDGTRKMLTPLPKSLTPKFSVLFVLS